MVQLGSLARLAIIALPGCGGSFAQQAGELFAQLACIIRTQSTRLTPTTMMVFLRGESDEAECQRLVRDCFKEELPVLTCVAQPPCGGAALGVELWAIGGPDVQIQRFNPHLLTAESGGIRWIYAGGIRSIAAPASAHTEAISCFKMAHEQLAQAGASFEQVVRTWVYVSHITRVESGQQRYQDFNAGRAEFYSAVRFNHGMERAGRSGANYPASTGIGSDGRGIVMACMAMQTARPDVFAVPLENPLQTSAYAYQTRYSPQSPRFSRALAIVQGSFVATLVSGTASIVGSETAHRGDIVRQTEQAILNIEALISSQNFERHGLAHAGATLRDIAKLRVYVKNAEDYPACKTVVERCLPRVPAIYLQADVCRPDLLVEIEAVAFSPIGQDSPGQAQPTIDPMIQ